MTWAEAFYKTFDSFFVLCFVYIFYRFICGMVGIRP